jgi:hypothetical protein
MTHPPPHPPLLTQRQLRRLEMLPDDYKGAGREGRHPDRGEPDWTNPAHTADRSLGCDHALRRRGRPAATAVIYMPVGPLIVVAAQRHAHRRRVPDNNPNQEGL